MEHRQAANTAVVTDGNMSVSSNGHRKLTALFMTMLHFFLGITPAAACASLAFFFLLVSIINEPAQISLLVLVLSVLLFFLIC